MGAINAVAAQYHAIAFQAFADTGVSLSARDDA